MKRYLYIVVFAFACLRVSAQNEYQENIKTTSKYDFSKMFELSSITGEVTTTRNTQAYFSVAEYGYLKQTKPLFAIKTNLLYDLATALNIELELPIKQKWSITGEYIFPWWQREKSNFTMQFLSGQIGVNYWLGNRQGKEVLTGWHVGLYGGIGKYDIQLFQVNGEQGRFYQVGVGGGYSHSISKNLRLEYQLGIGITSTKYKKYDKVRDTKYGNIKVFRYPWETKRRTWVGPTQVRVSLVWLINHKVKKENIR